MPEPRCRFCDAPLTETFVDLGVCPLSNGYLSADQLDQPETFYPLHARVCSRCFLVQVGQFESPQHIFGDYAYFSSYSQSWLEHCRRYVEQIAARLALGPTSSVIELASNDGYLLQYFQARSVPVLGIEPADNVARAAIAKGIPTEIAFFSVETARRLVSQGRRADLLIANNVLAHVPDLNDFVAGMKIVLAADGVATIEFPHLLELIRNNEFDTIYHEHFSYFSLRTTCEVLARHGLRVFDVEPLPTHGGSLRIYGCHAESNRPTGPRVAEVLVGERAGGLDELETYRRFAARVATVKCDLLEFLIRAKRDGRSVAGYGAPAKGNTLLNYCGVGPDLLAFTVDRSPHKQGRFLPGSRIPIFAPEQIDRKKPDLVLILPWNLTAEIVEQMGHVRQWGGRFVVPIPKLEVLA